MQHFNNKFDLSCYILDQFVSWLFFFSLFCFIWEKANNLTLLKVVKDISQTYQ